MKQKGILIFGITVALCLVVALLVKPSKHTYRVGAIYPMTGMAASMGVEFERGVRLAISNARERGVNIELVVEDSKTEVKTAVSAYHALRARGVDAVLTTVTGCASAIIPMAKADGIILFADVAKPKITEEYENLFRHSSTAEQEANVIFDHVNDKKFAKVLLLWMHDEYCLALRNHLLSKGGEQVFKDVAFDKEQNVGDMVSKAFVGYSANAVVVVGFGAPLGNVIKAIREFGFSGNIVANMGLTVTRDAREAAGEAIHGVYYTNMCFDHADSEYAKYSAQYKEKFGVLPNDYSLLAHNSALLLVRLAENDLYNAADAKKFLINLRSINSVGEKLTITDDRDILPPVVLSYYY